MSETNNTKQAAWVALGSMFSFAFGIVSSMILSRYFDKVEYGTYKQIIYVYNSLLAVFTLGLPNAYSYFLPKSPLNEAKSLISKITNLFYILGGGLSILLFFSSGIIADFLNNKALESALKIFSPVPFLMMPTMGLEGILATYRKTKFITLYTVVTRCVMLLSVALPVVLLDLSCNEAIVGFVIGSAISFVIALTLKSYPVRKEKKNITKYTYSDIFRFSLPLFIASIWGVLINSTDQFFISRYFGTEAFAEFSNGAMELPFVGMVIGACSTVLTPLFSKQIYVGSEFKTNIYPIWRSSFIKSAMLIYPVVVFCILDAEIIMKVMYGDLYSSSGNYFRIKLFTYFTKIISFYSILVALGATKFYSKVFMWCFILLLPTEFIFVKLFNSPLMVTAVHVLYTTCYCFVFLFFIAKKFAIKTIELIPVRGLAKILLASASSLVIVYLVKILFYNSLNTLFSLGVDFALFFLSYLFASYLLKIKYIKLIKPLLE